MFHFVCLFVIILMSSSASLSFCSWSPKFLWEIMEVLNIYPNCRKCFPLISVHIGNTIFTYWGSLWFWWVLRLMGRSEWWEIIDLNCLYYKGENSCLIVLLDVLLKYWITGERYMSNIKAEFVLRDPKPMTYPEFIWGDRFQQGVLWAGLWCPCGSRTKPW